MEAANLSGISDKDQDVCLFPFLLFLRFLLSRLNPCPCQPPSTRKTYREPILFAKTSRIFDNSDVSSVLLDRCHFS